jgi:dipeptidyl-peptidase 4
MSVFRFVLAATVLAASLPAQIPEPLDAQLKRIFEGKDLTAKSLKPFRWIDEGAAYAVVEPDGDGQSLVRYETGSGERKVLLPAAALKGLSIDNYEWSPDHKRLLIFTNTKKVWRQNSRGDYWIVGVDGGTRAKIGGDAPESSLMFAKCSPDGSRIAWVRGNNIYVQDVASGSIRQLTNDGSETTINGTSDWVNEEELGLRDCFRWSPDSRRIAYYQFDTTGVGVYTLINDTQDLYPTISRYRYPKVGTTNSAVRVGVVSAEGGETRWIDTPGDPRESYIPLLEWAKSSSELLVLELNRLQNQLDVFLADVESGKVKRLAQEHEKTFVDLRETQSDELGWLSGGKRLLWNSERDGWRHLYTIGRDGGSTTLLTPGEFDVITVASVDEPGGWVYYIASPDQPTQRYLYRSRLDGSGRRERITPESQPGTHSYKIAPDAKWAVHTYSTFDQPPRVEMVRLPEHTVARNLIDNKNLAEAADSLLAARSEFLRVDIGDGVVLDGWLVKPANFDPGKVYPLLVYVYGEPAGANAIDAWFGNRGLFHRALANSGYLVASFDNRGTPAPRGSAWRHAGYGSIGVLSSQEQAAAVRALAKARPYVDATRVGVWGWSGGGTNTLNLMFRYPELYKVGMAVAPVPDQKLYDTIYQERYMGLPKDNEQGYHDGSAINFTDGLQGRLLVVHGSGDDNVHYQGTERLVNRLVETGKSFDLMVYPNRTHAIDEGTGTSLHLHRLLARYLIEHLPAGPRP